MPFIKRRPLSFRLDLYFGGLFLTSLIMGSGLFLSPNCALAEEEKPAAEKSEGGKAEEGKAEEGKGEEGKAKPEGSDREWAKRTTKLNVLQAKIKGLNEELITYVKAKNGGYVIADEKGVKIDVMKKIGESQRELIKALGDYNHDKDELKYRYPEEGALIERKYVPMRGQTVEQVEKELGLNGDLTRTKQAVDKKYEAFVGEKPILAPKATVNPEATLKKTHSKKSSHEPANGEKPERLKLSQ